MSRSVVALTGATGFVGQRLAPMLADAGWRVRMLLRRDPVRRQWSGMNPEIVAGDLGDAVALRQLVTGADAVVHAAGVIKAARQRQFDETNVAGSARLAAVVAEHAPAARFLHVSTITAREPQLSGYAGSKRAGEEAVLKQLGARATVLRPPAVYGPGDRETLVFFQMAQKMLVPLAGGSSARAAMIHVDDLCSLLVALLREPFSGRVLTAADSRPEGYSWHEVFAAAARAVGNRRAVLFHAPAPLLQCLAVAGNVAKLFGNANMVNSGKLRELRHPDWSVPPEQRALPQGWAPAFNLPEGFANTVAWYRRAGWL